MRNPRDPARLLVFLLWGLVLISLILALFKSLMIWVPALLVALAVVYSLLLRTLLYQPSENHLGVIYRFDHLWRLVGPNERAIVIPGVDEVWAEISLNPRRVEVSLSDLWTKDLASINCELQVYYQLDLRRARADFLPQALRIPDDGWNSIIRTVLQEIASETVSSTILDELFSPAGRGDFKLALSKLLADRLKNLGLVVHPQSGVSVQAVMPEDTMWQAMVHRAASAATLPGEAALTRLRPILEELSRQHPEVAWEVLLEEWAATAVRQLEELSQKPPEVAWETILLEAVTVAA